MAAKQIADDIEIELETDDIFDQKRTIKESKDLIKILKEENSESELKFIKKLDYEEDEWIFWNVITGNSETMDFSFIHDSFAFTKHIDVTTLKDVLKSWVLHRLTKDDLAPASVDTYFKHLKEALILTNGFCEGGADLYCEFIKSLDLADGPKRQKVISVLNFLSFYDDLDSENEYTPQLFRLLINLKVTKKSRLIPSGVHILKFSNILEHFFDNVDKSDEKYIRYLPLLLWWKITTIIPLRPFEFCAIDPDCLIYEGEDREKCYLKLPRLKIAKKKKKYVDKKQTVDKIRIPSNIESLINEYKDAIKEFNHTNRKTLISRLVYEKTNLGGSHNLKRDNSTFLTPDLASLINAFYSQVIKNIYGLTSTHLPPVGRKSIQLKDNVEHDLIRVRSIDTRHIAFINMLAQGWSKPEIARFGGHRILETQEGYQNHREYWIEEETQKMMKKFRLGVKMSPTIKDNTFDNDMKHNDGYLLSMRLDTAFKRKFILRPPTTEVKRKVKLGICTDPLQDCKTHCVHCDFWRISPDEFEEKKNDLLVFIKESDNHIHDLFAFLKDLQRFVFDGELNSEIAEKILSAQKQIDDEIYKRAKLLYNLEQSNIGGVLNGK